MPFAAPVAGRDSRWAYMLSSGRANRPRARPRFDRQAMPAAAGRMVGRVWDMADDEDDEDDDIDEEDEVDDEEDDEDEEGEGRKRKPSKGLAGKKLLIIVGAALLLLIGGGAGSYFLGLFDPLVAMITGEDTEADAKLAGSPIGVYHEFPELIVKLREKGRRKRFLKLRFTVEFKRARGEDIERIDVLTPQVVKRIKNFVEKLSANDLKGSTGVYIMREQLLAESITAFAPLEVNDVMITEFFIQ